MSKALGIKITRNGDKNMQQSKLPAGFRWEFKHGIYSLLDQYGGQYGVVVSRDDITVYDCKKWSQTHQVGKIWVAVPYCTEFPPVFYRNRKDAENKVIAVAERIRVQDRPPPFDGHRWSQNPVSSEKFYLVDNRGKLFAKAVWCGKSRTWSAVRSVGGDFHGNGEQWGEQWDRHNSEWVPIVH